MVVWFEFARVWCECFFSSVYEWLCDFNSSKKHWLDFLSFCECFLSRSFWKYVTFYAIFWIICRSVALSVMRFDWNEKRVHKREWDKYRCCWWWLMIVVDDVDLLLLMMLISTMINQFLTILYLKLLFCTTGVLLRRLTRDPNLIGVSVSSGCHDNAQRIRIWFLTSFFCSRSMWLSMKCMNDR